MWVCLLHPFKAFSLQLLPITLYPVCAGMLFSRPDETGGRGRSLKCWTDCVREHLTASGLTASWFRKAQDRDSWRDQIQELLGHTQQ